MKRSIQSTQDLITEALGQKQIEAMKKIQSQEIESPYSTKPTEEGMGKHHAKKREDRRGVGEKYGVIREGKIKKEIILSELKS